MQRSVAKIAAVLLTASTLTWAAAVPAQAQAALRSVAFAPCADTNDFACGHLTVPLDPSGATAGAITLAIRRHRAPVGDEKDAVIALAGGPGQAALTFADPFASLLGPILSTRDLIVFDQRGVGLSHPLSCHRFEGSGGSGPAGPAIAECAGQIGPTRSFFTTAQSVADIEALRVAGGYEKLVLYGTSYGTKVAEQYAQAYPGHVEALVLDSLVPPNGPDPLNRATFAAVPRILGQLCARRACAHIAPKPMAYLAKLMARMRHRKLHGRWIDGHGHSHRIGISSNSLLETLVEGDLEPTLRSEFPAAIRSAANGDMAALARLVERAESQNEENEAEGPSESFDVPLFYTTTCEEDPFPWARTSSPSRRLAEARAQIDALPTSAIAPFTHSNVLGISEIPACALWPYTTPAPPLDNAPFPSIPTLILSGASDLRTPTANAREVEAEIPGSHLLIVPNVGHSVLGGDFTNCSHNALQAMFAGKPIKPCAATPTPALLRPTPLPPARLRDIAPARGNRGKPGRTLEAVTLTLADLSRQLALQALAGIGSGQRDGPGLPGRGGPAQGLGGTRRRQAGLSPLLLRSGRDRIRRDRPGKGRAERRWRSGRTWCAAARAAKQADRGAGRPTRDPRAGAGGGSTALAARAARLAAVVRGAPEPWARERTPRPRA